MGGHRWALHGEVPRVVVLYGGDDRLHELEEDQEVPANASVKGQKHLNRFALNLVVAWLWLI